MGRIYFNESRIRDGLILIDRNEYYDIVLGTDMAMVTRDSGLRFVPIEETTVHRMGWFARVFKWWPFGRRQQLRVKQIVSMY